MDHAINALMPFYDFELDLIAEDLASGKYTKLSECPSYASAKALINAIHILERYYYGEGKTMSIRDEMKWRGVL